MSSVSVEALSAPYPTVPRGEILQPKIVPETNGLFLPIIRMFEGQILSLQLGEELTGTMAERQRFFNLKYSKDINDRDLYFGTPKTRGDKQIIMANGFVPYNFATENPFVEPVINYWQNFFPQLKSNAFLEAKKEWYERHGHNVRFAFDNPNHIWFQNYIDTYNAAVEAIDKSDSDGQDVWIDGLSAGGMLGEAVLKDLAKEGIAINLISNGSPEVDESILQLFDESTTRPGLMGAVHKGALWSGKMDDNYEKMLEKIHETANRNFHPKSKVVRFYSNQENVCPPPGDPNAIEVGGQHAGIPYRKLVLQTEEKLLAS